MVRVSIEGIFLTQTQASGILLKDINDDRTLPIIIGEYEAQSIALGLEDKKTPRPITHDLILNILDGANLNLEKVLISELKDNTYYAVLYLESPYGVIEIDSRPSDAIAIAVRINAPIYVADEVMEQAAYNYSEHEADDNFESEYTEERIKKLKKDLQKAVESEEYEKAAQIRDKIKQLEAHS